MGTPADGNDGDEYLHGNVLLGPTKLPTIDSDPVLYFLLHGYSRFPTSDAQKYLDTWWRSTPGHEGWKWPNETHDGFLLDDAGQPLSSVITLKVGDLVDRFGQEDTKYFAPFATPFRMRSLPTANLRFNLYPYGAYRVKKPFKVHAGPIAPGFEQPGMGVQYKTELTPAQLVEQDYIDRISDDELRRLYKSMMQMS